MNEQDEVILDEEMVAELDATGTVWSLICMSENFPYKDPFSVTASQIQSVVVKFSQGLNHHPGKGQKKENERNQEKEVCTCKII
jgi:hypothetical protein